MYLIKLDSKGRLLIPFYFRKILNIVDDSTFKIYVNDSGEIMLKSIGSEDNIKLRVLIDQSKLGKLAEIIEGIDIKIMNSSAYKISSRKLEFMATLSNMSKNKLDELEKSIEKISKNFEIETLMPDSYL